MTLRWCSCVVGLTLLAAGEPATLAVVNGRIWTGDAVRPWASGLAVAGDRILAVGTDAEVRAVCVPGTRVVNAEGALVTPGFIDSHIHLMVYDRATPFPPIFLRFLRGKASVAEKITGYAAALPKGDWILGEEWTDATWGGPAPSQEWLDRLAPDHPVWLVGKEGNAGIANSAALRAAGLVRGGPMWRVEEAYLARTRERDDRRMELVMDRLLSVGVTSVHHNNHWSDFLVLRRLHQAGRLRVRVYASPPLRAWERLRDYISAHGRGDTWMHWGGLKGFGAIMAEDYQRWVSGASAAAMQVMVHVGGGADLDTLLGVFERVRKEQKLPDPRFRVEHAHDMQAEAIPVMALLGVIASWQPPLLAHADQRTAAGAAPPKNLFPCRALRAAGVKIAFGTDSHPDSEVVSPAAVLRMALERAAPDGSRITLDEALRAYTLDAAYAEFAEKEKGSLEVGKLADLVVFDRDFSTGPVSEIGTARVRMTVVGGVVRFEAR